MEMLTLFGKDLSRLTYNELRRELAVQKYLHYAVKSAMAGELTRRKNLKKESQTSQDKEDMSHIVMEHLEAFIAQIEHALSHRNEPLENATSHRSRLAIRRENEKRRKAFRAETTRRYDWQKSLARDTIPVLWDKERFMRITADRGYQTEEAVIHAIGKELDLDRARAKVILDKGRFTWGQVLCLGGLMEMTPKEFCDTFLSGYFTDQFGEYRADYDNIEKKELLKRAIKPQPMEEVIVGADGRPLDEEKWFDD